MEPELWLTRYRISADTPSQQARLISRGDDLHKVVMYLFGAPLTRYGRAEKRILWRLETDTLGPMMLIQSAVPPTDAATALPHIDTKPVRGLRAVLKPGLRVAYRVQIAAASRYREHAVPGKEHRRCDVRLGTDKARDLWLTKRAIAAGLAPDPHDLQQHRVRPIPYRNVKSNKPHLYESDIFNGTATITDHDALWNALNKGIGLRKTWGCGLLTIAPETV